MLVLTWRDLDPGEEQLAGKHPCLSISQSQLSLKKRTHILRFPTRNGRPKKAEGCFRSSANLSGHPSLRFRFPSGTGKDGIIREPVAGGALPSVPSSVPTTGSLAASQLSKVSPFTHASFSRSVG